MEKFNVPTRDQVSPNNQAIFDHMLKAFGKVPNLYAILAINETALADYLALQNRKSTLSGKEREVINLVVSEVNNCQYCVPAHTAISKLMFQMTEEDIIHIRKGEFPTDKKLDSLVKFVKETTLKKGRPSEDVLQGFYGAGYNQANLIDAIIIIGDKIISNYLHNITQIPVDWPAVPSISHQIL